MRVTRVIHNFKVGDQFFCMHGDSNQLRVTTVTRVFKSRELANEVEVSQSFLSLGRKLMPYSRRQRIYVEELIEMDRSPQQLLQKLVDNALAAHSDLLAGADSLTWLMEWLGSCPKDQDNVKETLAYLETSPPDRSLLDKAESELTYYLDNYVSDDEEDDSAW